MKKFWFLLIILSILIGLIGFTTIGCSKPAAEQTTVEQPTVQTDAQQYTCPMHPEVLSDEPGKCPECGMNLVPVEKDSEQPAETPQEGE